MSHATHETLENALLADNRIGISLHPADGPATRNYVLFEPANAPSRAHFFHGRDFVNPEAAFDDRGQLIASAEAFTPAARDCVEHYFAYESLPDRKPSLALGFLAPDDWERRTVERLGRELGDSSIPALYDNAIAMEKSRREALLRDPASRIEMEIGKFQNGLANLTEEEAQAVPFLLEMEFARDIRAVEKQTGIEIRLFEDGALNPDHYRRVMEHHYRELPHQPLNVLNSIRDTLTQRVCDQRKCDIKSAGLFMSCASLAALGEAFEELQAQGVFEQDARKRLGHAGLPPDRLNAQIEALRNCEFDPEQVTNLVMGMLETRSWDLPPPALMDAGRHVRTENELKTLAAGLGDPYRGALPQREHETAERLVASIPFPILEQGLREGLCVTVEHGDSAVRPNETHRRFEAGGYDTGGRHAHPFITLAPERFSSLMPEGKNEDTLESIARHEFRHYWADTGGYMAHADLPAAVQADHAHIERLRKALSGQEETPERNALAAALGTSDALALTSRLEEIVKRSQPWLQAGAPEAQTSGGRHGYAARAQQLEEAFPCVDQAAEMFGMETTAAIFPNVCRLMERLDREFAAARTKNSTHRSDEWAR